MQLASALGYCLGHPNLDSRPLGPMCNLCATICQGMLRVLEPEDTRPGQRVDAIQNSLKYRIDCCRLASNALLTLVIEGPVETVEIQV
jgi:hypothetical protein